MTVNKHTGSTGSSEYTGSVHGSSGKLTVRYFAAAQAATGLSSEVVPVEQALSVSELFQILARRHSEAIPGEPPLLHVLTHCSVLRDGVIVSPEKLLRAGDSIDIIPPFSGG